MDCRSASKIMAAVLDEGADATSSHLLTEHLATCPSCPAEWARVQLIDGLLCRRDLVDPPNSFFETTMRRVHAYRRPITAPDLSVADAGVVFLAAVALSLVAVTWLRRVGLDYVDARVVLLGVRAVLDALPALPTGAVRLAIEAAMAGLVAVLWFAAILVPRRAPSLRAR